MALRYGRQGALLLYAKETWHYRYVDLVWYLVGVTNHGVEFLEPNKNTESFQLNFADLFRLPKHGLR